MALARRRRSQVVGQGPHGQELRRDREVSLRILVLGAGGQVARAVVASAPANHAVIAKTRQELDISDEAAVMSVLGSGADWIVNGAAYTAVDLAETESEQARKINDTAVGVVARAASRT